MNRVRADVLVAPWLWLSIGVLAVNDHLLKASHPGWLTGKLSDVAGVAMLALAGAAITGRRWPVLAVGAGFIALKSVPGVASLAAPVLGGETLRDPSDLLALAVLVPIWRWLATEPGCDKQPGPGTAGPVAAGLVAGLQVVGLAAVVASTSATSCAGGTGVAEVTYKDGRFHAFVADVLVSARDAEWVSADGREWRKTRSTPPTATEPSFTTTATLHDETTVEAVPDDREVIVTEPDGQRSSYRAERPATGLCIDDPARGYQSVATDGRVSVVALGSEGIAVRSATGEWTHVAIGRLGSERARTLAKAAQVSAVVVGGASVIAWIAVSVLVVRRRPPRTGAVIAAVVGGIGFMIVQALAMALITLSSYDVPTVRLIVWSGLSAAVWVGALVAAYADRRPRIALPRHS